MFVGCLVVLCIKDSLIPEPLELVSSFRIVYVVETIRARSSQREVSENFFF